MNIRMTAGMRERLERQSARYGFPLAEIVRKAVRKWKRRGGVLSAKKHRKANTRGVLSRNGSVVLRVRMLSGLASGMNADEIRSAVDAYLTEYEGKPETMAPALELESGVEGIDYEIVEMF